MRWVMVMLVVVVGFGRAASATGLCENTPVRYDPPELFDEATQSFAVSASQAWCDVNDETLTETYGAVSFVELRDTHDKVLAILSTAQGADATHLRTARGDFEPIAVGKLHATLVARGYKPIVSKTKGCKLSTAWTDADSRDGWRGAALQLDVQRGKTRLSRVQLGEGSAARRGDQWFRAHVLAKQSTIAVFAIVPSCGGPPPGYFGTADGGSCYHDDTPIVVTLDATTTPALAACF